MNKSGTQTFTYTAQRGAYISTVLTFLFMMLGEGGALTFIITLFIHNSWLRLLLVSMVATLLFYMLFGRLLAPFYTKHRLDESHLQLHYGFALNIRVPIAGIASARPVRENLTMFQPIVASYDTKKQRVVAAFSGKGQVLLVLDKPHMYKVGRASVLVQEILVNVDEREVFLEALGAFLNDRWEIADRPGSSNLKNESTFLAPTGGHQGPNPASLPPPPLREDLVALKNLPKEDSGREPAIHTQNLTRTFASFKAVDNLNLSIARGEIYGFLGSNGAGKTTTMKMLVGLLEPSEGQVWLAGYDVWREPLAAKAAFGYVADRAILYERLTAREFLRFLGQMRGLPRLETEQRIECLLHMLELAEYADRPCGGYSFGMKRKLALMGALLHEPAVLILDEPLNGLDPRSARRLKDLLLELAAGGTTILLSTHDLATAEAVCQRVGILHGGHLLAEGSTAELEQLAAAPDLEGVFLSLTAEEREGAAV